MELESNPTQYVAGDWALVQWDTQNTYFRNDTNGTVQVPLQTIYLKSVKKPTPALQWCDGMAFVGGFILFIHGILGLFVRSINERYLQKELREDLYGVHRNADYLDLKPRQKKDKGGGGSSKPKSKNGKSKKKPKKESSEEEEEESEEYDGGSKAGSNKSGKSKGRGGDDFDKLSQRSAKQPSQGKSSHKSRRDDQSNKSQKSNKDVDAAPKKKNKKGGGGKVEKTRTEKPGHQSKFVVKELE